MNRIARLPFAVVCGLAIAGCLSLGAQLLSLLPALVAAAVAYFAVGKLLGVREMQALLSLRSRRSRG
jgi:MFS superfamily sulfate permease-like transporter